MPDFPLTESSTRSTKVFTSAGSFRPMRVPYSVRRRPSRSRASHRRVLSIPTPPAATTSRSACCSPRTERRTTPSASLDSRADSAERPRSRASITPTATVRTRTPWWIRSFSSMHRARKRRSRPVPATPVKVTPGERLTLRASWAKCPVTAVCGDGICGAGEAATCVATNKACTPCPADCPAPCTNATKSACCRTGARARTLRRARSSTARDRRSP